MRLLQSSASSRDDLKRRNQELDLRPPSLWNGPVATAKTNSTPPFHCPSTHTPRGTCPIQQAKGLTSFEVMPGSSLLPYRASSSSSFFTRVPVKHVKPLRLSTSPFQSVAYRWLLRFSSCFFFQSVLSHVSNSVLLVLVQQSF